MNFRTKKYLLKVSYKWIRATVDTKAQLDDDDLILSWLQIRMIIISRDSGLCFYI